MKWKSDRIISVSAILVSVMTLVVLVVQMNMEREQQRLSVQPYLSTYNQGYGTANYQLMLSNNGLGPAFVEDIEIIYKDSSYKMDLPTFLFESFPETKKLSMSHSNVSKGRLIRAGENVSIFRIKNSKDDAYSLLYLLDTLDLKVNLIYQSLYKERWLLTTEEDLPVPLD